VNPARGHLTSTSAAAPRWLRPVGLVLALAMLAHAVGDVWPFIADDAFISARYGDRLLSGHGLTWNDGERVEGYSNLLWLLATAGLRAAGMPWVSCLRLLGILCTAGSLFALAWSRSGQRPVSGIAAALVLAALAPVALWTIAGLETSMAMCLSTLLALLLGRVLCEPLPERRSLRWSAAVLALLCLVRPEGPLWLGLAAAAVMVFGRGGERTGRLPPVVQRIAVLVLPALLLLLAQEAFRLAYYGDWIANTTRAKLAPSTESITAGFSYLARGGRALRALLAPASLGLVVGLRARRTRPVALFSGAALLCWCGYLLLVGGDFFPMQRMLVPVLGPAAVLAALGFDTLSRLPGRPGVAVPAAAAFACAMLARFDAHADAAARQELDRAFEWQALATGHWLAEAFARERPVLAVDAAGAVPFASGLPTIDMLGLCDVHIARQPAFTAAGFHPGHMQGDGSYVLDRGPDLVLFAQPPGTPQPIFPSGLQMEDDPRFLRDYRCVQFDTGPVPLGSGREQAVRITAWVRLSGRLGPQREGRQVVVPGWWLDSYRQPYAFHFQLAPPSERTETWLRDAERGLHWWQQAAVLGVYERVHSAVVGKVSTAGPHLMRGLPLAPGTWSVAAEPADPSLLLELLQDGRPCERTGDGFVVASGEGGAVVDLQCTVPATVSLPRRILRLVFTLH
jgi:hypothetical protein